MVDIVAAEFAGVVGDGAFQGGSGERGSVEVVRWEGLSWRIL